MRVAELAFAVATVWPVGCPYARSHTQGSTKPELGATWQAVDWVLGNATLQRVFPGAVALVGDETGTIYTGTFGNYTDDGRNPPLTPTGTTEPNPTPSLDATRFDMASCTKVTATTSAIALLYERGLIGLDDKVQDYLGSAYASQGKDNVTILNCLLHNTGYPPDPTPEYWAPAFGCHGAPLPHSLSFNCSSHIFAGLQNQTLDRPIGVEYVYSDLSMITLMYVVGRVVADHSLVSATDLLPQCGTVEPPLDGKGLQCYYEAFVRRHVLQHLGMDSSGFLPSPADAGTCMPTAVPVAEHAFSGNASVVLQGKVNDGNAYMLGGIAGHAGLFSTARDMDKIVRALMWPGSRTTFLNATTVQLFTTEYNHSQSSRALGWDTNDPTAPHSVMLCGNMSAHTFTHTGYTGTQVCGDQALGLYTILLTNRVYPNDTDFRIEQVRKDFNNAVLSAFNHSTDKAE